MKNHRVGQSGIAVFKNLQTIKNIYPMIFKSVNLSLYLPGNLTVKSGYRKQVIGFPSGANSGYAVETQVPSKAGTMASDL